MADGKLGICPSRGRDMNISFLLVYFKLSSFERYVHSAETAREALAALLTDLSAM